MFSFFKKTSSPTPTITREVLSNEEILDISKKIRNEYSKYAKNNPILFNVSEFEKRYELTISSNGNISIFLNEELKYFLELKKKYYLIQVKENQTAFNQISENLEKQISKYPLIDFHPIARKELKYFLGAINQMIENEFVILETIFKGTASYYNMKNQIIFIEDFGRTKKNQYSKQIIEYTTLLNQKKSNVTNSLIEKNTQLILKTACFELKKLIDSLNFALEDNAVSKSFKIESLKIKKTNDYFFLSYYDATKKVIENMIEIIKDFRMDQIVKIK